MKLSFSIAILMPVALIWAAPQQKATIIGKEIKSTDAKGETDDVGINSPGKISGNYRGGKGTGKYSTDEKDVNGQIQSNAIGPGGQREFMNVDKKSRKAVGTSDKGQKVNADANNEKEIVANVNGNAKQTYNVHRPKPDTAIVQPKGGGKTYEADGLSPGMHDVSLKGGPMPIRSQYETKDVDKDGKPEAINTRETEELLPGVGNVRDVNTIKGDGVQNEGSITAKNSMKSPVNSDPLAPQSNSFLNPSMTVTEKKIEAQPCVGDGAGNDMLGDNGFKLENNKITVEYPSSKDGQGTQYTFPNCFTVKARLKVPPGTDMKKIGFQGLVYLYPSGTMQCEQGAECKHNALGKPNGPCFFCDLCTGDQAHKLGHEAEMKSNLCSAVPGSTLPLSWQVCPPKNPGKYEAFKKDFLNDGKKGDIDVVIEIFQLKVQTPAEREKMCSSTNKIFGINTNSACNGPAQPNQESWALVGCRKSRLSYNVVANGVNLGSAKDAFKGLPNFGGGGSNGGGAAPSLPGFPSLPAGGGLPGFPALPGLPG